MISPASSSWPAVMGARRASKPGSDHAAPRGDPELAAAAGERPAAARRVHAAQRGATTSGTSRRGAQRCRGRGRPFGRPVRPVRGRAGRDARAGQRGRAGRPRGPRAVPAPARRRCRLGPVRQEGAGGSRAARGASAAGHTQRARPDPYTAVVLRLCEQRHIGAEARHIAAAVVEREQEAAGERGRRSRPQSRASRSRSQAWHGRRWPRPSSPASGDATMLRTRSWRLGGQQPGVVQQFGECRPYWSPVRATGRCPGT